MARLALRMPTGEWAAMVVASSRARSRAVPGGDHLVDGARAGRRLRRGIPLAR